MGNRQKMLPGQLFIKLNQKILLITRDLPVDAPVLKGEGTYKKSLTLKPCPSVAIGGIKVAMVGKAIWASRSCLSQMKDSPRM